MANLCMPQRLDGGATKKHSLSANLTVPESIVARTIELVPIDRTLESKFYVAIADRVPGTFILGVFRCRWSYPKWIAAVGPAQGMHKPLVR